MYWKFFHKILDSLSKSSFHRSTESACSYIFTGLFWCANKHLVLTEHVIQTWKFEWKVPHIIYYCVSALKI